MRLFLGLFGFAAAANAHFVLQIPGSLGFEDTTEDTEPCGGFDATNRSAVTDWDVNGDNIGVITTHSSASWEINAALVSDTSSFVPMVQQFAQTGVGNVCFKGVPGFSAWLGQPVVLQVVQHGPDGELYQCAAIQFVAGGPAAVPSDCTDSAGVSIAPIVAAPGPTSSGVTSSLELVSSKTTTTTGTARVESTTELIPAVTPPANTTIAIATTTTSISNLTATVASPSKPAVITSDASPLAGRFLVIFMAALLAVCLAS